MRCPKFLRRAKRFDIESSPSAVDYEYEDKKALKALKKEQINRPEHVDVKGFHFALEPERFSAAVAKTYAGIWRLTNWEKMNFFLAALASENTSALYHISENSDRSLLVVYQGIVRNRLYSSSPFLTTYKIQLTKTLEIMSPQEDRTSGELIFCNSIGELYEVSIFKALQCRSLANNLVKFSLMLVVVALRLWAAISCLSQSAQAGILMMVCAIMDVCLAAIPSFKGILMCMAAKIAIDYTSSDVIKFVSGTKATAGWLVLSVLMSSAPAIIYGAEEVVWRVSRKVERQFPLIHLEKILGVAEINFKKPVLQDEDDNSLNE